MVHTNSARNQLMNVREIVVVAAAIVRPLSVIPELFIARRGPHDQGAGVWEFPGGKVEEGESFEEALHREIREELDIEIKIERYLGQNDFYLRPDFLMHLHVFLVQGSGTIKLVDHDQSEWHSLKDFPTLKISAADQPFVRVLQDLWEIS